MYARVPLTKFDLAVLAAAKMDALTLRPFPNWPRRSGWFMGSRCVERSVRRLVRNRILSIDCSTCEPRSEVDP